MNDIAKTTLDKYGINAVIGIVAAGALIWFLAHFNAAPGGKVSVLWGLVEYTKKLEIPIATGSTENTNIKSNEPTFKFTFDPLTLHVIHNVTQENYEQTIKSLRVKNNLRELTGVESNLPVSKLSKGTYFFLVHPTKAYLVSCRA